MNCPHCQRLLYSRQHPRCGYCGGLLPESVRLTDHEIDEMKAEIREIEPLRPGHGRCGFVVVRARSTRQGHP